MTLTWRPDHHGSWLGYFTDALDRWCVLRQSNRTRPVITIGLEHDGSMHLTQQQVNELLPHLVRFVETGSLREPGAQKG